MTYNADDFDAFVDRTAREVVAHSRQTSEGHLLRSGLSEPACDRVLDLLDVLDCMTYEQTVATLRASLPAILDRLDAMRKQEP